MIVSTSTGTRRESKPYRINLIEEDVLQNGPKQTADIANLSLIKEDKAVENLVQKSVART